MYMKLRISFSFFVDVAPSENRNVFNESYKIVTSANFSPIHF